MVPIAIVTGAARGIGFGVARQLAIDGYRVIAADRDDTIQASATALQAEGLDVVGHKLDIRDRDEVAELCASCGQVDVVVNNAGIASPLVTFSQIDAGAFKAMIDVNVRGTFIVAQEAVRRMKAGGRVINIASRGYLGGAGSSHYVASKAAVVGLTRAMAVELRWQGITVNAVAPGMVDTRMLKDFTPEMRQALERREPSGKAASPAAIANAVSFLASEQAANINGQVLLVDGGKSVGIPLL